MPHFILDTNFISEIRKARPNKGCVDWFLQQDVSDLYLTIITMAEIAQGIAMRENDSERAELSDWLTRALPQQFAERILTLDLASAAIFGNIAAKARKSGRARPVLDALIASIAIAHDYPLVTGNVRDFEGLDVKIVNPFS